MATFGETLKRERELRKISLREVSEATKIGLRYLEALEANRFDRLPGGLFNKGFIRAYAKFIGLDGEAMVNAYLFDLNSQQNPQPARPRYAGFSIEEEAPAVPPVEEPAPVRPRRRALAAILGAGLVIAAVILWLVFFRDPSIPPGKAALSPPVEEKAQIIPERTVQTPSPPATGEKKAQIIEEGPVQTPPPPATGEEKPQTVVEGTVQSPLSPAGDGEAQAVGGAVPEVPPPAVGKEKEPPAPAREALSLVLTVSETTWIAVACDGTNRLARYLAAGDSARLSCQQEIRLDTGNAGTTTLQINGHDCVPLGDRGEVIRDFVFDRARAIELCPPPSREP